MDSTLNEMSREVLLFEARKYSQGQFTFVPDGDSHILIGSSYGTRRTFLARVPLTEVGAWLLEAALTEDKAQDAYLTSYIEELPALIGLDLEIKI